MKTLSDQTQEFQNSITPKISNEPSEAGTAQLVDNRAATMNQRKLQETMHVSKNNSANPIQRKANNTGLPDSLKSGIENLSGYSMDDVKVHYNSSKPAQLQAHAYAQGTDIHLASGQEKHLPHEAWHVVQQKQGRVKPTKQLKSKVSINDDAGLEKEADVMGARATLSNPKSAKNRTLTQRKTSGIIQKKGERAAIMSTRNNGVRRGNRRKSVIATQGKSTAKVGSKKLLDEGVNQDLNYPGFRGEYKELEDIIKQEYAANKRFKGNPDNKVKRLRIFIAAEALKYLAVGNCGEFADAVFSHLVQNTENQYIYRAMMVGQSNGSNMDHGLVLRTEEKVTVPKDGEASNFKEDETTVIDAWNGYRIQMLSSFLEGDNPYNEKLTLENLKIIQTVKANNRSKLSRSIKDKIKLWAETFNKKYDDVFDNENPEGIKIRERAKNARIKAVRGRFFPTQGSEVKGIQDLRPMDAIDDAEIIDYLESLHVTKRRSNSKNIAARLMYIGTDYKNEVFVFLENNWRVLANLMVELAKDHENTDFHVITINELIQKTHKNRLIAIWKNYIGSEDRETILKVISTENSLKILRAVQNNNPML
ncbi:DUF4157 domain-containing protein [Ascidiimonas sp. W6]|uniref:eCIS core domain-containing protein n=1 Tax=Ascidiimonas meishanensis TaxID=3128903 RepID=UPI0030EEBA0A